VPGPKKQETPDPLEYKHYYGNLDADGKLDIFLLKVDTLKFNLFPSFVY
jgi:hypothetical protein